MGTRTALAGAAVAVAALAACSSSGTTTPHTSSAPAVTPSAATTTSSAAPSSMSSAPSSASSAPRRASRSSSPSRSTPTASRPRTSASTSSAGAPVIVLDPGHSVSIHAIDPATGLDVSDYENEPEMRDVFAVALIVRARLMAAGYRVVMTKNSVDQPESLGARAALANRVHAALALSIHDQAGADGGIGFDAGNNTVYYQSVGTYRVNVSGRRIYFTNARVAAVSQRYGQIFQRAREAAQHTSITLLGNTGYDLGSRGRPAGDIWIVQLLSHVPWIYNEAGGNSAGQVGLDPADERTYAAGLVAAVEACVPIR